MKHIQFNNYDWNIIGGLKVLSLLVEMQLRSTVDSFVNGITFTFLHIIMLRSHITFKRFGYVHETANLNYHCIQLDMCSACPP